MANIKNKLFTNPALQRAWRTFFQAFVALFVVYLLPFLTAVVNWAGQDNQTFPNAGVLVKAAVSAVAAGAVSLVSLVMNGLEDKSNKTLPTLGKTTNTP